MASLKKLAEEIEKIKQRNTRVESDKAWETSLTRKIVISALTYIVVYLFFLVAHLTEPFFNSIIATSGFLLSTLTIPFFKDLWVKYIYKK